MWVTLSNTDDKIKWSVPYWGLVLDEYLYRNFQYIGSLLSYILYIIYMQGQHFICHFISEMIHLETELVSYGLYVHNTWACFHTLKGTTNLFIQPG